MSGEVFQAAVVTVSDSAAAGEREDLSGPLAAKILGEAGFNVAEQKIVPDEFSAIIEVLCDLSDRRDLALVITTGGTGFGPRDMTPEATAAVIERQADNLSEFMRFKSYHIGPKAALSRGVAGIRGETLILNLPGSPAGVEESLKAIVPILGHALTILKGGQPH